MESNGFYISLFEARGSKASTVSLKFEKGCNVVIGKSDTGKTTLYNIIEYVLGKSSTDLTLPPEGAGYTEFYLEIHTYEENVYTIMRRLNSTSVHVCNGALSDFDKLEKDEYSCSTKAANNFSDFILAVSNVPDIYAKSSDTKNPSKVSISMLRHLFMIDETRVSAKDKSPLIFNPIPNQQWVEKNFVSYLMTGLDDREFRPNEDPKDKKSRINGKLEYLDQTLIESEKKLELLGDVDYISLTDTGFIESYRSKLADVSSKEEELYNLMDNEKKELNELAAKKRSLSHLIGRLEGLKCDYESEIKRIEFINTGSQLISQLQDVVCPLCGAPINEHRVHELDNSEYVEAIRNEYNSLYYKHNDIGALVSEKRCELGSLEESIQKKKNQVLAIGKEIDMIVPNIGELKDILAQAESNLKKKFLHAELVSDIDDKRKTIERLKQDLASIQNEKGGHREDVNDDFLGRVKSNLVSWNFITENTSISFDYKKFDIKLGDRNRSSYGKGNRAITFTAILMALLDYCYDKSRAFSRLLIIDSPLCTKYGEKNAEEDRVQLGTIDAFAKYCNTKQWNYQFITIDNKFTEQLNISDLTNINIIDLEAKGGLFVVTTNNK